MIPDLDYANTFKLYAQVESYLPKGIPCWWTGGTLVMTLLRRPHPSDADLDILVHDADYEKCQVALKAAGWKCVAASAGVRAPSNIGDGPSSTWKRGLTFLDVIAIADIPGSKGNPFGSSNPAMDWLETTDLNVCGVAVGPDPMLSRIVLHATSAALDGLIERRVEIVRRHATSDERMARYQQRLGAQ